MKKKIISFRLIQIQGISDWESTFSQLTNSPNCCGWGGTVMKGQLSMATNRNIHIHLARFSDSQHRLSISQAHSPPKLNCSVSPETWVCLSLTFCPRAQCQGTLRGVKTQREWKWSSDLQLPSTQHYISHKHSVCLACRKVDAQHLRFTHHSSLVLLIHQSDFSDSLLLICNTLYPKWQLFCGRHMRGGGIRTEIVNYRKVKKIARHRQGRKMPL